MSDSLKQASLFLSLVVAVIKGDDAQAKAIKIQKKAIAGLTAQIAIKNAATLTLEDNVEQAEEALALGRINNGEAITNIDDYIKTSLANNRRVEAQKLVLKDHKDIVAFLESELELVSA